MINHPLIQSGTCFTSGIFYTAWKIDNVVLVEFLNQIFDNSKVGTKLSTTTTYSGLTFSGNVQCMSFLKILIKCSTFFSSIVKQKCIRFSISWEFIDSGVGFVSISSML